MTHETNNLDPFTVGGWKASTDDRQQVLALFQQWIRAAQDADATLDRNAAEYDLALDRMTKAENDIAACSGAEALAMKIFFLFRYEHANWAPEPYVRMGEDQHDPLFLAALRTAADLVPEIEEFAAPIFHEDAKLIDADIRVTWARLVLAEGDPTNWSLFPDGERRRLASRLDKEETLAKALDTIATTEAKTPRGEAIKAKYAGQPAPLAKSLAAAEAEIAELRSRSNQLRAAGDKSDQPEIWDRVFALDEWIATTAPTAFAEVAVKLRRLADPKLGIETGASEEDPVSVRQVLAFIEAALGEGGAE
jgi:hypothetical protein